MILPQQVLQCWSHLTQELHLSLFVLDALQYDTDHHHHPIMSKHPKKCYNHEKKNIRITKVVTNNTKSYILCPVGAAVAMFLLLTSPSSTSTSVERCFLAALFLFRRVDCGALPCMTTQKSVSTIRKMIYAANTTLAHPFGEKNNK